MLRGTAAAVRRTRSEYRLGADNELQNRRLTHQERTAAALWKATRASQGKRSGAYRPRPRASQRWSHGNQGRRREPKRPWLAPPRRFRREMSAVSGAGSHTSQSLSIF